MHSYSNAYINGGIGLPTAGCEIVKDLKAKESKELKALRHGWSQAGQPDGEAKQVQLKMRGSQIVEAAARHKQRVCAWWARQECPAVGSREALLSAISVEYGGGGVGGGGGGGGDGDTNDDEEERADAGARYLCCSGCWRKLGELEQNEGMSHGRACDCLDFATRKARYMRGEHYLSQRSEGCCPHMLQCSRDVRHKTLCPLCAGMRGVPTVRPPTPACSYLYY